MVTKNEVLRKCNKFLLSNKNRFAYRVCKVIKDGEFTDFLSSEELANLLNEGPGKHIKATGFFSQMRILQKEDIVIVKATGRGRGIGRRKLWGPGWLSKKIVESRVKAKEDLPRELPFSREPQKALGKKAVFLVHGHDEAAKESTARFVEKLGLRAIILHEQPNAGKTVIEKFEAHSNVGFAIVLLTPDDIGAPRNKSNETKPRARQNVILELGYFMGKLGRGRVCALYKEGVEIPSDYQGILYIQMDSAGAWRMALAKEIKNAGIDVDLNKL
jgi:predicted nucleotide-binding protein